MTPAVEKYVLHWGEMGTRWGTNRTVAQVQALLYLSPKPLRADEIVDLLSVARSNVSTSIRELQSYGLVRMTHILGDRRDYFESLHDVWELFRVIIEQRKQRELNPTLTMNRKPTLSRRNAYTICWRSSRRPIPGTKISTTFQQAL
jgi:DNA-binding transcriptional regulator GbsR (MarR family)